MSTATTSAPHHSSAPSDAHTGRRSFLNSRIGSLLAVVPLGVWTIAHVWNNLAAFQGPEQWQVAVTEYPHPIAQLLTSVVVLLPLLIHTVWGISRIFTSRPNNIKYGFYGNLKYALQRLSAIGVLLFICAHIWLAFLSPHIRQGHAEIFSDIAHEMHYHTPTLIVYILGTLGVGYHLANGIQGFSMGWGIVGTRQALKRLEWAVIAFFLIFMSASWGVIYALYHAGA